MEMDQALRYRYKHTDMKLVLQNPCKKLRMVMDTYNPGTQEAERCGALELTIPINEPQCH